MHVYVSVMRVMNLIMMIPLTKYVKLITLIHYLVEELENHVTELEVIDVTIKSNNLNSRIEVGL